ncbi:MAG: M20 family metallopeptidase [Clostridia bacterium]|nr:M20 family metallopeptidase [Clostridia bacterium]
MKKALMEEVERLAPQYYEISDYIHANPELGYQEFKASKALTDRLKAIGFDVEMPVADIETAFKATYQNGEGGPSFGLLVEYDALKDLGHACGHHMQGPTLILCAEAFKNVMKDKPYKLVVYGTPAEETSPAKIFMYDRGCFRDIDVALMVHASYETACDLSAMGKVTFTVTFHGKNAHAAMFPENGRSAFDALLLSFNAMEFLREHIKSDCKLHYTCLEAGETENVVPSRAVGRFTLRSRDSLKYLDNMKERFRKIIEGAALMTETTYDIEEDTTWPNKIPTVRLNEIILKNAHEVGCPDINGPRSNPGSTDFGGVMYHMPGCNLRIKYVDAPCKSHTPPFAEAGNKPMAHDSIRLGAKTIAGTCFDILENPEFMEEIKASYAEAQKRFE